MKTPVDRPTPSRERLAGRVIGILGGMGPLATADFMREIILHTPASGDADHIPLIVSSLPQIPDRVGPILTGNGDSPIPAIRARLKILLDAGARCIAMPCNTAHFWYDEIARDCPVPFLSIVDATLAELSRRLASPAKVGLIGTAATLQAELFQRPLAAAGYIPVLPDAAMMEAGILPGIRLVKQNHPEQAAPMFRAAIDGLIQAGASVVVLACTEVPSALRDDQALLQNSCIDTSASLARACIAWALET